MQSRFVATICLAALTLLTACDESTPPGPPLVDAQLRQDLARWGVIPIGAMPAQDPALVALGRTLMFDKILSGNRDVSCATCHQPAQHLGDGLSLAVGTGGTGLGAARTPGTGRPFVPRNAPTLLNAGLGLTYVFWDGRLARFGPGGVTFLQGLDSLPLPRDLPNVLAEQAMLPVLNRVEMRGAPGDTDVFGTPNELAQLADTQVTEVWQGLMNRLLGIPEYVTLFSAAFPGVPTSQLRFRNAATAIAAFEMQAFTKTGSPFDHYLDRDDGALTAAEKRGAILFFERAQCASCHNGPFLGAQGFANTGAPQLGPGTGAGVPLDFGRGNVSPSGGDAYRFTFRIAPLRNVELTAPYFHDGAYPTLEAVVRHYNDVSGALRGFDVSQLSPSLQDQYHGDATTIDAVLVRLDFRLRRSLGLTDAEQRDLVAFLKSLTDPSARDLSAIVPARVPSGLPVP